MKEFGDETYGKKYDVWFMGVTLATMVHGLDVTLRFRNVNSFLVNGMPV
jgi:hypothetical protein